MSLTFADLDAYLYDLEMVGVPRRAGRGERIPSLPPVVPVNPFSRFGGIPAIVGGGCYVGVIAQCGEYDNFNAGDLDLTFVPGRYSTPHEAFRMVLSMCLDTNRLEQSQRRDDRKSTIPTTDEAFAGTDDPIEWYRIWTKLPKWGAWNGAIKWVPDG